MELEIVIIIVIFVAIVYLAICVIVVLCWIYCIKQHFKRFRNYDNHTESQQTSEQTSVINKSEEESPSDEQTRKKPKSVATYNEDNDNVIKIDDLEASKESAKESDHKMSRSDDNSNANIDVIEDEDFTLTSNN